MIQGDLLTFGFHMLVIVFLYPTPTLLHLYFRDYSREGAILSSTLVFIIFSVLYTLTWASLYFTHANDSSSSYCKKWLDGMKGPILFNLAEDFSKFESCLKCGNSRPYRTHHCRRCNECILVMDHHCPWMGICIGLFNKKAFILFSFYSFLLSFVNLVICVDKLIAFKTFIKESNMGNALENRVFAALVVLSGTSVITMLTAGCFFCFNLFLGVMNNTTIERKIDFRQRLINSKDDDDSHYENLIEVFGKRKIYWLLPFHTNLDKMFVLKRCLEKESETMNV